MRTLAPLSLVVLAACEPRVPVDFILRNQSTTPVNLWVSGLETQGPSNLVAVEDERVVKATIAEEGQTVYLRVGADGALIDEEPCPLTKASAGTTWRVVWLGDELTRCERVDED